MRKLGRSINRFCFTAILVGCQEETLWSVFNNLREVAALFFQEENLEHAEHFRNEHFVSLLAFLSDIFEKFGTLNTSMQGNDINIIVVTDKVKVFIGKLDSCVKKLEKKSLEIFSRLKDFVD
jgi:hypothetical protein